MVNRYPTNIELKTIKKWKIKNSQDIHALMDYIKLIWNYSDMGYWKRKGNTYWISTGGWSGNEDIIETFKKNLTAWYMIWYSSRRGGHYILKVPKIDP